MADNDVLSPAVSSLDQNDATDLRPQFSAPPTTLTVVIPALNERDSIVSIIQRCVDARDHIKCEGGVAEVEIIVVNDGSTDETGVLADEMAAANDDVKVIHFHKKRGYGAALKEGFRQGRGEFVAFLDADGTCDPVFFADMCAVMRDRSADIVLGSRMGAGNEMPFVRTIGNRVFALLLGVLSGKAVTDTASGMRVIRRSSLRRIEPLPDGLQFTPAMSARALLDGMAIQEVAMTYSERQGESKLHPLRDGVRFLVAILTAMLLFRPARAFDLAALVSLFLAFVAAIYPIEYFFAHGAIEEGMIFRLLMASLLVTCTFMFAAGSVLATDILLLSHRPGDQRFLASVLDRIFSKRVLAVVSVATPLLGVAIVWQGLWEWLQTQQTQMHWSRALVGVLLVQVGACAAVTCVLRFVVGLWRSKARSPAA
ncbi:MAG: glycosyltransferase family 2 protein [Pirellulales bacterium]